MTRTKQGCKVLAGFTLLELLVTVAIIGILAALLMPALAGAKAKARSANCRGNLHQIGLGMQMYVDENRQFPGSCYVGRHQNLDDYYVWPPRLLPQVSNSRGVFSCPAARSDSWWNTNINPTLGAAVAGNIRDPWAISRYSRFSVGYNDWGLGQGTINKPHIPQLGLGGDVNPPFFKGFVRVESVLHPEQMIMFGDSKDDCSWDGSLDPTEQDQWPSNRHNRRTNLDFADGHAESPLRKPVIDPKSTSDWRHRWNIDDDPHPEITWVVNWSVEVILEK